MPPAIETTDRIAADAAGCVAAGLGAANAALVGPSGHLPLAVVAREADQIVGGVIGSTAWGWLYIQQLWVAEAQRGAGLGTSLMEAAEQEAIRRGCGQAWIDTFNPAALRLYQRLGYLSFGVLTDFPPGHTRHFLRKPLAAP